jgi:hypothetical protein
MLEDNFTLTHYGIVSDSNVEVLMSHLSDGDIMVCFARQHTTLLHAPADADATVQLLARYFGEKRQVPPDAFALCNAETGLVFPEQALAAQYAFRGVLSVNVFVPGDPCALVTAPSADGQVLYLIEVAPGERARDLKRKVAARIGVPAGRITFSAEAKVMDCRAILWQFPPEKWKFTAATRMASGLAVATQFGALPIEEPDETVAELKEKIDSADCDFELFVPAARVDDVDRPLKEIAFPERANILIVPRAPEMITVALALESGLREVQFPADATVADARFAFVALGTFPAPVKRIFCNGRLLLNDAMRIRDCDEAPNRVLCGVW